MRLAAVATRANSAVFRAAGPARRAGARARATATRVVAKVDLNGGPRVIRGKCFVTKDNIDTDQIIPAEYLTLVPSKPVGVYFLFL
jgi:hypothetical protein